MPDEEKVAEFSATIAVARGRPRVAEMMESTMRAATLKAMETTSDPADILAAKLEARDTLRRALAADPEAVFKAYAEHEAAKGG